MFNRSKGKHRKPQSPIRRHVLTGAAIVALLAGTGALGAGLSAIAPQPATAATVSAEVTSVNWQARTCTAFARWEKHPTTGRLDTIVADSFRVPRKYLGEDVAQLFTDVLHGGVHAKYVADDEKYLAGDCRNVSGL